MTLTDEQRADVLESLRVGCTLDVAAKGARTTSAACRDLAVMDEGWAADLAAAEREGAALAAAEVTPAPTFAEIAAMCIERDKKPTKPRVDLEAWSKATTREEAQAAVGPARRTKGTDVDRENDPEIGDSSGQVPTMCNDDGSPDWDRIRLAAERDFGPGPFGLLMWQEERLAARGFPRMHPWWSWNLENFYASMKRWLLVLAGRGMGKSSVLTRVAAVETAFTSRRIPPGQTWIWPFVSVRPSDAKRRLQEIKEIYGLGYHYALGKIGSPEGTPTLAMDDSRGQSVAFVSFASTLGNVSGPNGLGATVDEEEKIERDTSEIIGSLIAMFRARAGIRGIRCSSAMGVDGSLYRSIQEGDTITNYVARIGERFLSATIEGFLAVAEWEDARSNSIAATTIRAYAAGLTAESTAIPSWTGNLMDEPNAASRAIALRIDAEGVPPHELKDLPRWRYFLREWGSWPTGSDAAAENDTDFDILGVEHRYGDEMRERSYGR